MPCGVLYTDDTQLSLTLIDSLVATGKVDADYVKRLWVVASRMKLFENAGEKLTHHQFGLIRGTGRNFRQTVDNIADKGMQQDFSGPTGGNGAAMRVIPLAIWAWKEKELDEDARLNRLGTLVISSSILTHHSFLGVVPAFAYAVMLMNWIGPPGDGVKNTFRDLPAAQQLAKLAQWTRDFELRLLKQPSMQRDCNKSAEVQHCFSSFLEGLAKNKKLFKLQSPGV